MPLRHLRLSATSEQALRPHFDTIRQELEIPAEFPVEARMEAEAAAREARWPDLDLTEVPLVTIDPPESRDLDQALHLERRADGYLVRYAIADVAAFVRPGGALDREVHRRGVTYYGPDRRDPLHPRALSEAAASLLPDQTRPALVWEITLDADGNDTEVRLRRAVVRSRAKLSYEQVQQDLDTGHASEPLRLLREVGQLRLAVERARGGVSLPLPEQEISKADGGYRLSYRQPMPVESWNAQISLLTGMAAAKIMVAAGVGVLRSLPAASEKELRRLRFTATALRIDWPGDLPYAQLIPTLDPAKPAHAAFLNEATMLFRGATYTPFNGSTPDDRQHSAIAADYAHVTAPLRRLVDRYGLEICAALIEGRDAPEWALAGMADLPPTMAEADRRANNYDRMCVDVVEAAVMTGRVGDEFAGVIVDVARDDESGEVVIEEPAVRGRVDGKVPLGEEVAVRLAEASVDKRRITFAIG